MRFITCLGIALLASTPAYADSSPCSTSTGGGISVHGSAMQRLHPDRVTFTMGVQTRSATVTEAFKENTARTNAVIDGLKKAGVASAEIQTSFFDVTTIPADRQRPRSFMVSGMVTVTRSDTKDVGKLLQTAIDAGANQAGSLRFSVVDVSAVRKHGLELAFQDARAKAETLAALSNRALGDVVCVSDESSDGVVRGFRGSLPAAAFSGVPQVEPGLEERSFDVFVVFELK